MIMYDEGTKMNTGGKNNPVLITVSTVCNMVHL